MTATEPCCDVWPKIEDGFYWFTFVDHPEFQTLANIPVGERQFRVNYCPSCGADRRGAIRRKPE